MEKKENEEELTRLILDTKLNKYELVNVIAKWVRILKAKEEYKHIPYTQLIDIAIRQVLTGEVKIEDIKKEPYPAPQPIKKRKRGT